MVLILITSVLVITFLCFMALYKPKVKAPDLDLKPSEEDLAAVEATSELDDLKTKLEAQSFMIEELKQELGKQEARCRELEMSGIGFHGAGDTGGGIHISESGGMTETGTGTTGVENGYEEVTRLQKSFEQTESRNLKLGNKLKFYQQELENEVFMVNLLKKENGQLKEQLDKKALEDHERAISKNVSKLKEDDCSQIGYKKSKQRKTSFGHGNYLIKKKTQVAENKKGKKTKEIKTKQGKKKKHGVWKRIFCSCIGNVKD